MEKADLKDNMVVSPMDDSVTNIHTTSVPVEIRFADMDSNGHMFFGNYFTLFDTAFLKYLEKIEYPFSRFLSNNLNLYYVEAKSQFKAPINFNDEVGVAVQITSVGNTSFTVTFEVTNKTSNKSAALGHIVAVVVDLKSEKSYPLPDEFLEAIGYAGP